MNETEKPLNDLPRDLFDLVRDAIEAILGIDDIVLPGLLEPKVALVITVLVLIRIGPIRTRVLVNHVFSNAFYFKFFTFFNSDKTGRVKVLVVFWREAA